jgi:hypothetical protein
LNAKVESIEDLSQKEVLQFPVMMLIDTRGCGMQEDAATEQGSHRNNHEADIVLKHVKALLDAGLQPHQIGVVTPYNGQLELLKGLFNPADEVLSSTFTSIKGNERNHSHLDELRKVEIKTIDGFQVHIVLIIHTFVFPLSHDSLQN